MKEFHIRMAEIGFTGKEGYQVGTVMADGTWLGVSRPFENVERARRFLDMMLRNERVCEERRQRILNGDFYHDRKAGKYIRKVKKTTEKI